METATKTQDTSVETGPPADAERVDETSLLGRVSSALTGLSAAVAVASLLLGWGALFLFSTTFAIHMFAGDRLPTRLYYGSYAVAIALFAIPVVVSLIKSTVIAVMLLAVVIVVMNYAT